MSHNVADLYRRYAVMVRNRALRLLGCSAAAQDVTQEVFVKMLEYTSRDVAFQNIGGLLYRMATNISLDRLRVRHRSVAGCGCWRPWLARPWCC